MSIATELQRILATKKDLRNALNIDDSVPFSQYAAHIPWHGETPPASTRFFDFVGNRYSADGFPALLSSLGITFTRLSSATQWKDGVLVDVATNVMRIDVGKGLLIEPQSTNVIVNNTLTNIERYRGVSFSATSQFDGFMPDAKIATALVERGETSNGLFTALNPTEYPLGMNAENGYLSSVYVKYNGSARYASLYATDSSASGAVVDLVDGLDLSRSNVGVAEELEGGWWRLKTWYSFKTSVPFKQFRFAFGNAIANSRIITEVGDNVQVAYATACDSEDVNYSVIKTYGTPTTRAADHLAIPVPHGQTIVADMDEGVTYEMDGGEAVFTGHGYIRSIRVKSEE